MTGIPALLALGALAALANLAGGLLLASSGAYRREAKLLKYLIALGAGFMLAAIFSAEMTPPAAEAQRQGRCRPRPDPRRPGGSDRARPADGARARPAALLGHLT